MTKKSDHSPGHNDKNPDVSKLVRETLIARITGLMTAVVKLIDNLLHD